MDKVKANECATKIAFGAINHLSDIICYLEDLPDEYHHMVLNLCNRIENDRNVFLSEVNAPLIALKRYRDCRCSWERAGEISGLGIFGLIEYCSNKGVDWRKLRIDEYYNFSGPEAEKELEQEWSKLVGE